MPRSLGDLWKIFNLSLRTVKRIALFPLRALGYIMETSTVKNFNIFFLGLAFMLVFTGFNTMSGIQVCQI